MSELKTLYLVNPWPELDAEAKVEGNYGHAEVHVEPGSLAEVLVKRMAAELDIPMYEEDIEQG